MRTCALAISQTPLPAAALSLQDDRRKEGRANSNDSQTSVCLLTSRSLAPSYQQTAKPASAASAAVALLLEAYSITAIERQIMERVSAAGKAGGDACLS